ncbi:sortase B protein-sorting domain-containing protein [Candidatus Woesearchaeota archaeon]|nr:sortase B protein-sorting domain-containing protein [Candidatus Woesearchaeota archaeon]
MLPSSQIALFSTLLNISFAF